MKTVTPVVVHVRLEKNGRWASVAISLEEIGDAGPLVRYSRDFTCSMEGADETAATYQLENWQAGLLSGAFYGFRRMNEPRRTVMVSQLEGKLASEDMEALALAGTIAVTELLGGDCSQLKMPGWQFRAGSDMDLEQPRGDTANVTRVRLQKDDRWVQVALSLGEPWEQDPLTRYSADFSCNMTGIDPMAAGYALRNWEAAIISGAFYAFGSLNQQPRRVLVCELEGRLGAEDMSALALASAAAVTELLGGDATELEALPGWQLCLNPDVDNRVAVTTPANDQSR